jgi:hypothetical protein
MPLLVEDRETRSTAPESPQEPKVLLMCQNPVDVAIWRDLLQLPACMVQACHDYIEFLLYLEHEAFQLVVICEGENPSADWRSAAVCVTEAGKGIPLLIIRAGGRATGFSPFSENPN